MNLYHGGFGKYEAYVVADSEADAIKKLGEKMNAAFLPLEAEIIDNVDGYYIIATEEAEVKATSQGVGFRSCKKCDFTCDSRGALLAHYRENHPKAQEG